MFEVSATFNVFKFTCQHCQVFGHRGEALVGLRSCVPPNAKLVSFLLISFTSLPLIPATTTTQDALFKLTIPLSVP